MAKCETVVIFIFILFIADETANVLCQNHFGFHENKLMANFIVFGKYFSQLLLLQESSQRGVERHEGSCWLRLNACFRH